MSLFLIVIACLTLCASLISIAKPELYIKLAKNAETKKSVGPTYWGTYPGSESQEPSSMKIIEAPSKRGKHTAVAGSLSYSKGQASEA